MFLFDLALIGVILMRGKMRQDIKDMLVRTVASMVVMAFFFAADGLHKLWCVS